MPLAFRLPIAFALAASLASPALAADAAELGSAGTAAYDQAAGSGVTPETLDDMAMCAAYWDQWYGAIDSYAVSDELLAELPEAVDSSAALQTMEGWFDAASIAWQEDRGNIDGLMDQIKENRPWIADEIVNGIGGDVNAFESVMETLGTCKAA